MTLVGRDDELEAVAAPLDAALDGGFRALVLTGEPGIGKTTLLAAAAARGQADRMVVLRARAVTQEREVPFALAAAVLDDHARAASPATAEAFGGELATILRGGPPPDSAGERFRYHRALRALLEDVAGDRPLLLALDDLQWADEASREWLEHLLRRPPRCPAALLLATRPGPDALRLVAAAREAGEHMALGPLPQEAARAMLQGVEDELAECVIDDAGGNPLFLRELGRAARRGPRLPATIAAALEQEVAELPAGARRLLGAAAVCGDPFDDDVAAAACGMDDEAAAEALDALAAADLVRPAESRRAFAFRHPLVRRAVYDALAPAERVALHREVAAELGRRGAAPAQRAPHVAASAGTGDAEAVDLLRAAGQEAFDTAPAVAAAWWQTALDLLGAAEPGMRRELLAGRARALAAAGRPDEALAAFDEVGDLDPATTALAAQIERNAGRAEAARARLEATLERTQGPARAQLELELAAAAFAVGDLARAQAHAHRATEAWPDETAAARTLGGALDVFARLLAGRAAPEDLAVYEEAALALPERDLRDAAGWLGTLAFQAERYESAGRLLARAIAAGERHRADHLLPPRRITCAVTLVFELRLGESVELAEAGEEGARLQGVPLQSGWAGATRALALDLLGRRADAEAAARGALADLDGADPGIVSTVSRAIGLAVLHAHDPERVLREVGPLLGSGIARASTLLVPLVGAALATGERDRAEALVASAEPEMQRMQLRAGQTRVACARAELCLAAGDAEGALRHAETAAAVAQRAGLRLDGVRARIALGRAAAAAGERERAQQALEDAFADAARAGAEALTAEAARALRAAGLRTGARALRAVTVEGELTQRERDIAELVAGGRSNKEVAGTLFLSAKTVENNLSRIYAKLGVRSRTELARALHEGDAGGSHSF